jgi:hypothetical protein
MHQDTLLSAQAVRSVANVPYPVNHKKHDWLGKCDVWSS